MKLFKKKHNHYVDPRQKILTDLRMIKEDIFSSLTEREQMREHLVLVDRKFDDIKKKMSDLELDVKQLLSIKITN